METVFPDPSWAIGKHALMNLRVKRRNGRSEIDPSSWRIPYQWQGTHYQDHDDQPFLLLINSGGGFVEGDVAELHATLEPGTRALITTTAASKFYKCLEDKISRELATLRVGADALLEYYPDESIPFAQSRVERRTRIEITSSSKLFATDMISAGRIHHGSEGEAFAFHSLNSEFAILVDGKAVVLDRLLAMDEGEVQALRALWEDASHMATVVAYGDAFPDSVEGDIEEALAGLTLKAWGASRIGKLVITCRILADETWACHEGVQACWKVLRPFLAGKKAKPIRKC